MISKKNGSFHTYAFRAFGVAFEIRTNAPELIEQVSSHFPPGFTQANGRRAAFGYTLTDHKTHNRRYEMSDEESSIPRSSHLGKVLDAFESRLRLKVAEFAPQRIFVHAGVVSWKDRAIILPGKSFSGKTTLVRELIKIGADYYSDEYAVLDSLGRTHPFLRPLEVRAPNGTTQRKVRAQEYGARIGSKAIPVGLIVISAFQPGSTWRPRRLSPGRGALEVLLNTVPARRKPRNALEVIQRIVSSAPIVSSRRGEAQETALKILRYFDDLYPDN